MAMSMRYNQKSRFLDLSDEPVDHLLSPIKGYQGQPLISLIDAVQPISHLFDGIEDYVFVAHHNCQNPADGLTQQESASIHLYTMEFHGGSSLYILLNQSLRSENRKELIPWFSFLKLFLTALHKVPSQSGIVYRGIRDIDLSSKYKKGTKFPWWAVSSCTSDIEVLESAQFLGKHGQRTLFSIECTNGKPISNHSYFKNKEKEIILMPGSYFEVIGQLNLDHQLHIIQLKEIPSPVTLVQSPFIVSTNINSSSMLNRNNNWKQVGFTVAGGNGVGNKLNQLDRPQGIYIDDDQTIYIADFSNNRIVEWKPNATNSRIVAGKNGQENQTNQLYHPTDVIIDDENNSFIISDYGNRRVLKWSRQNNTNGEIIISNIACWGLGMDKDGSLYVVDSKKNEVRRWKKGEKHGIIVAGGNGVGNHLDQLNDPTYIFIDKDYSLYISDAGNHRVMKWMKDAKQGVVVAGGNGKGDSSTQLSFPQGVTVDQFGRIYVADFNNHRVIRWSEGAEQGTIIVGGNKHEHQSNQLRGPIGLQFDRQGNLYVAEYWNYRIQKFEIILS